MKRTDSVPETKWGPWSETFFYAVGVAAGWLAHLWSGY